MKHLDLFSGIGGFALATEMVWPEVEHIFCDIEPFSQAILKKHWPNSIIHGDIIALNEELKNGTIVLWNEGAMASAPTVQNDQKQKDVLIANPAIPSEFTSGIFQIEKNAEQEIESGRAKRKTKSSNTMEAGVSVAEKAKLNFLPLTTQTEEETLSAKHTNPKHGNSSERTASPRSTKYSATTAATPNTTTKYVPTTVDLLTGGFPCQPFSQAGRRKGTEDGRHLWPAMLETIRLTHPRWVVGENVGGFVTWNDGMVLEQVHADLEGEGYEVQAFIIPAVSLNAPHRRDRVWIVAHGGDTGLQGVGTSRHTDSNRSQHGDQQLNGRNRGWSHVGNTAEQGLERPRGSRASLARESGRTGWEQNWLEVAIRLCTLDDGLPNGLARPRGWRNAALKGAGNAIVPQVAAEIFKAIKAVDEL